MSTTGSKLELGQRLRVVWRDAMSWPGWMNIGSVFLNVDDGDQHETVGHFVRANKWGLSVAQTMAVDESMVTDIIRIPWGIVEEVYNLDEGTKLDLTGLAQSLRVHMGPAQDWQIPLGLDVPEAPGSDRDGGDGD